MKIFTGRFGHECNTMSCRIMEYEDVLLHGNVLRGQEAREILAGSPEYLGGIIRCAEEHDAELVVSIHTEIAMPRLSLECLEKCVEEILVDLRACKDTIDGICFVLHGAGCAVGVDDMETYILREFRKVVGPDMPITIPLDLHGNISPEMVSLADGLFSIKQYPHTDYAECGYLAMEALIDMIRTGERPETVCVNIPLLIPAVVGNTFSEPMQSIVQYIADYTAKCGLIDATFMHGFPYADVPYCGASVIVVAREDARAAAEHLADYIWARREKFIPDLITVEQAFDMAGAFSLPGYILMSEPSDNPGGGCPGDGTHLLREMLKRDLPGSIFTHIYDPEAAQQLIRCGIGGKTDILLGGKIEPPQIHGAPLEIQNAEVLAVSDGNMISNSPMMMGLPRSIGPCARIKTGNVEIIVGSVQNQTLDDRPFPILGTAAENYRIIGIKSANHYKAFYQGQAALIIPVETPGIHCADLKTLTYRKIRRPMFPIDLDFPWNAAKEYKHINM